MPYIKMPERPKFKPIVESVVELITGGTEAAYTQGEYFGFYANRVARRFLNDPNYTGAAFNSAFFNEKKKTALTNRLITAPCAKRDSCLAFTMSLALIPGGTADTTGRLPRVRLLMATGV